MVVLQLYPSYTSCEKNKLIRSNLWYMLQVFVLLKNSSNIARNVTSYGLSIFVVYHVIIYLQFRSKGHEIC